MKRLSLFILLSFSVFLAACNGEPIDTNMSENVIEFEFTTQDNESLSLADLEGEYWIANFIFTNCTTVCLPMTANMSLLQDKLDEEGIDTTLVSFTVDPEYDTPEVLMEYGESYDADFSNWHFLTGYDFETIREVSIGSFKSLVAAPPEGSDQVTHGTNFFLVNPEGKVIKNYNGIEKGSMDSIVNDMRKIAGK